MADILAETNKKMDAAIGHLKNELKMLRTGRASPAMVEQVTVEVYGTQMRLPELASISAPEPRQLMISPYDASNVHAIVKGIEAANLNLRAYADGNVVRIKVPEMDTAVRTEMVKKAKKMSEDAKISIRNIRRDSNEFTEKEKKAGTLDEDAMKKLQKKIQELTDKFCKMCDELTAAKEKEIQTI